MKKIYFAGGCFWGVEYKFSKLAGVVSTNVGYMGGQTENPTYNDVCTHTTGHAEVVMVEYDCNIIDEKELISFFFEIHDPTQENRQGPDIGTQYRSAIFYTDDRQKEIASDIIKRIDSSEKHENPIVTELVKAGQFWIAEDYHQKYLEKKGATSCSIF